MRFDSDISTKKMEGGASAMLSVYGCVKSNKILLLLGTPLRTKSSVFFNIVQTRGQTHVQKILLQTLYTYGRYLAL